MDTEKYISTQGAILIAGALVGAGLFFGLRGREPPPSARAPAPSTSAPERAAPAGEPPSGAAPPAVIAAEQKAALAAAIKDLERYRSAVIKDCVKPALAKDPDPPTIKLTFNVTFNAEGQQIMRGVVEDRETMREGVSSCAMKTVPALSVPPQGASIAVEIPWTLP